MMRLGIIFCAVAMVLGSCRTSDTGAGLSAEFGPQGVPMDWGNLFPTSNNQTVEANLANAAARRLNQAAGIKGLLAGIPQDVMVVDGIVSVPIKFLSNDGDFHNHPFGDGQKNASVGWIGWPETTSDVPFAASLVQLKSRDVDGRLLVLEPSISMIAMLFGSDHSNISAEISNDLGEKQTLKLKLDSKQRVLRGVLVIDAKSIHVKGTESYPADTAQAKDWLNVIADRWAWPRVKVRFFKDGDLSDKRFWPLLFRFPAQVQADAQMSLPPDANSIPELGRQISLPPYASANGATSAEALKKWLDAQPPNDRISDFFPAGENSGVHHMFTDNSGHTHQTATGGVDTYVIKKLVGKTQVLYTCFDARNVGKENQWGVPSGAGWHSIGHELPDHPQSDWTFAETVVNSFERSGIFAGWGVRTPYPFPEEAPFEAKDVATFRVLRSNDAFTTSRKHFHWYAVDASQKVCTIIWKHLGCELVSDRSLRCK